MIFRDATIDDLSRLVEMEQAIIEFERPYNLSIKDENVSYYDLIGLIGETDTKLLVVEIEDQIVGSGYAQVRASRPYFKHEWHCYLGFIFIDPDYRGQSLGRRMLDKLIHWGKSQGVITFQLDVYAANQSAVKLYEKLGFKASHEGLKLHF